jgi:hypothetical protein
MARGEKHQAVHQVVLERGTDEDQRARVSVRVAKGEDAAKLLGQLRGALRVVHVLHVHRTAVDALAVQALDAAQKPLGVSGQGAVVV